MEPFTLLVTETRAGAERLLSAAPHVAGDEPAVVALNEPAWYARLRAHPRQRHVGVAVESLSRLGLLSTAVTAVAGATRVTLVTGRGVLGGARLDELTGRLAAEGLAPSDATTLSVDGEPAVALTYHHGEPDAGAGMVCLAALADLARAPRPAPAMGVRLATVGTPEETWFGGWARAVALTAADVGRLGEATGRHLDVLLVAGDAGAAAGDLADEARAIGAAAVGIDRPPGAPGKVDVEVRSRPVAGDLVMARPVDPRVVNPVGYREAAHPRLAVVLDGPPPRWDAARPALVEAAGGHPLDVLVPGGVPPPDAGDAVRIVEAPAEPAALLDAARDYRGVVDHPGLHSRLGDHAANVVRLAAAGVPFALPAGVDDLRPLIGDGLADVAAGVDAATFADPLERERASVRLRRAALRTATVPARWRQLAAALRLPVRRLRRVSILLPANRADFLDRAVAQVNAQRHNPCELVVALHGEAFPADVEQRLTDAVEVPLTLVKVPAERCLGDVLGAAADAAGGEVLAKMDDDDWYSPDHVEDLVAALDYSAATLVGKGAEFCYLADLDLTVRRTFDAPPERAHRKLAGGTLAIPRADLEAIGGWRRVGRAVDQRLIDDVLHGGGTIHRTHGFGYVLNRHGQAHTWTAGTDYFLKQTSLQRPGLDLAVAEVQPP